jgi:hypothetical protein
VLDRVQRHDLIGLRIITVHHEIVARHHPFHGFIHHLANLLHVVAGVDLVQGFVQPLHPLQQVFQRFLRPNTLQRPRAMTRQVLQQVKLLTVVGVPLITLDGKDADGARGGCHCNEHLRQCPPALVAKGKRRVDGKMSLISG